MTDRTASAAKATRSIRGFMWLWISAALCLFALVEGWMAYEREVRQMQEAHDRALARVASGYLRSLRNQEAEAARIPSSVFREELGVDEPPALRFNVVDAGGRLVYGDAALGAGRGLDATARTSQAVFYEARLEGEGWRVVALRDQVVLNERAQPVVVQVAESHAVRAELELQLLLRRLALQTVRLLATLALVGLFVVLGLRPLEALRHELRQRKPQDLAPITGGREAELAPIVDAMNALLREQRESLDQQRRFLADASHQLRTPLAVLRTQVQGMLLKQTETHDTLPKMLRTIDRASGLTDQLLSLVKVEQLVRRGEWYDVDLHQVAQDMALEFSPLIGGKRLDFSLQATPVILCTDGWLLGELIKNLLSNAIHHSERGGALGIVVRRLKSDVELVVWDHGGGVEEDMMARLFEPFNASKGGTGIGLGLSICRQIAEAMGATVDIFNRIEGGHIVGVDAVVRLPGSLIKAPAPATQSDGAGQARADAAGASLGAAHG